MTKTPLLPRLGRRLRSGALQNVLLLGLLVLIVLFQLTTGVFLNPANIRGILLDSAVLLIVAVPASLLLISGFVDLSIGSVLGLGGVTTALLLTTTTLPPLIAVLVGVAAGAAIGLLNATLITVLKLSPLIVTLGTLSLAYGVTRGVSSLPLSGFPPEFRVLGGSLIAGIPLPVIIAVVIAIAGWIFATRTPAGRHVYAVGANPSAAYLSGLRVRLIPFTLYVVVAAAAAFGGIVSASRLGSASPGTLGVGFEITVLTALLLGGVNFAGGSGSVIGVVIGVLFLGVLRNGLTLIGIPDFWQDIATGAVLVFAAGLNYLNARRLSARH
ncbi:ABC transporter permease [Subtercola sp. YIM 133946]|uniref:ABC transporter permease n=1 Tax=Subtercola sp. YIM 133946 TaxID=3118909 RepID=UPI002F941A8E